MTLPEQIQTEPIILTEAAAKAAMKLIEERDLQGYALRFFVQGGGCSGFQYGMAFDNRTIENDLFFEAHGVKIVVDDMSIRYLNGTEVDYVDGPSGGFTIHNPNAVTSCGCSQGSQSSGCSGCG
ncbi:MAG: iron-sulfur cluster insertion protein ErpA [Anaerolineales bacterium]|nr:iron-sulfur cluster insertion protein ErpA [Anaerolineales bacterium]